MDGGVSPTVESTLFVDFLLTSSPMRRLANGCKPSSYRLPFLHQKGQKERVRQKLLKN